MLGRPSTISFGGNSTVYTSWSSILVSEGTVQCHSILLSSLSKAWPWENGIETCCFLRSGWSSTTCWQKKEIILISLWLYSCNCFRMLLVNNVHKYPSIHCANNMYHNCTLRRSSLLNGTCSITFNFTTFASVFFTEYTKVYVRRLYFVRRPENATQ